MQVRIVGDEFLDPLVRAVDVLGITREGDPAEGPDSAAEQRTDVCGDEAGKVEGIGNAVVECLLANVIAIVERRNAPGFKCQHGLDMAGHGMASG